MWQSCKSIVPSTKRKRRAALIARQRHPLSSSDRNAVGKALTDALGVMSGKTQSASKYDSCLSLFPKGAPADADNNPEWFACKDELKDEEYSLLQPALAALKSGSRDITGPERAAIGDELAMA